MLSSSIHELVDILKDYEKANIDYNHIIKWLEQFELFNISQNEKKVIIDDLINVFKITYFSKNRVINFLNNVINNNLNDIINNNCSFLDVQSFRTRITYNKSESQKEYVILLKSLVKEKYNINISINNFNKNKLIYLDDYLLTGRSFSDDLDFINSKTNLKNIEAHFLIILYEEYNKQLRKEKMKLFNRVGNIDCIVVLKGYYKYYYNDKENNFIYSDITQNYFQKANEYIVSKIEKNKDYWNKRVKSMFISAIYRNIPNNAPICLWWGDVERPSIWLPLLQRVSKNYLYKKENSALNKILKEIKSKNIEEDF